MVWRSKGLNPHVSKYSYCCGCVKYRNLCLLPPLYILSPPIYYYALCLLKPPLDQSGYASCYRRYRLDITLWYNRGLWLCTLCLCVQTYTISYPIHDHYYCMFYYVSMRLISTSINQWLFRFYVSHSCRIERHSHDNSIRSMGNYISLSIVSCLSSLVSFHASLRFANESWLQHSWPKGDNHVCTPY